MAKHATQTDGLQSPAAGFFSHDTHGQVRNAPPTMSV
jgi:hypothetical protein